MTERLPADHEAVTSHRVHLERVGRTSRLRVPLPDALSLEPGAPIRLSLEGEAAHAVVDATLDGTPAVERATDNPRMARTGEGPDRLRAWLTDAGRSAGDPVVLDVLTEGYAFGLRAPGERVIYDAPAAPDDSLADIAEELGE